MRRLNLQARPAFSYRRDKAVPPFDDRPPIVFVDGQCALCTRGARLICRLDRRGDFKIVPTQSELARAILCHYGLNAVDPASWLYLEDGKPTARWTQSSASAGALADGAEVCTCCALSPASSRIGSISA